MLKNSDKVVNGKGMKIKNLSIKQRGETWHISFDVEVNGQLTPSTLVYDIGKLSQIGEIDPNTLIPTFMWDGTGSWNENNIVLVEVEKKRYFRPFKFCEQPSTMA